MAMLSHKTIGNESLEKWEPVGSGGFGQVYKATHKEWGFDVAIKIHRHGISPFMSLFDEAKVMDKASCEFVLRHYSFFEGCPPGKGTSMQSGIVMEFMERGSVESLQKDLSGRPPWPLVFRLAHQVALGMNFLHLQNLMHHDLKPSNVLLNIDFNAKLADFGLSRVSTSVLSSDRELAGKIGGSYKYKPPEAFDVSYEPVRAFDRYSYGILLWSIVTGKEPYPMADYDHVEVAVNNGQRPSLKEIDQMKADGLKELVDLMKRCWDDTPSKRPLFTVCIEDTRILFSKYKKKIHEAVHQVSARLESPTSNQHSDTTAALSVPLQAPEQSESNDIVDCGGFTRTERSSVRVSVSASTKRMSDEDKEKFVDDNRGMLIQNVSEVMAIIEDLGKMVHGEAYSCIEAKSTSQEKMRVLYQRTLRSGGVVVKAAFYDALKIHESELLKRLGGF